MWYFYPKYSDTVTPYHTCPKIEQVYFYCLLMCLKVLFWQYPKDNIMLQTPKKPKTKQKNTLFELKFRHHIFHKYLEKWAFRVVYTQDETCLISVYIVL